MWGRVRDYSAKLRDCVTLCCGLLRIQFLYLQFLYPSFSLRCIISCFISGIYSLNFCLSFHHCFQHVHECTYMFADTQVFAPALQNGMLFHVIAKPLLDVLVKNRRKVYESESRACPLYRILKAFWKEHPLLWKPRHCKATEAPLFSVHQMAVVCSQWQQDCLQEVADGGEQKSPQFQNHWFRILVPSA